MDAVSAPLSALDLGFTLSNSTSREGPSLSLSFHLDLLLRAISFRDPAPVSFGLAKPKRSSAWWRRTGEETQQVQTGTNSTTCAWAMESWENRHARQSQRSHSTWGGFFFFSPVWVGSRFESVTSGRDQVLVFFHSPQRASLIQLKRKCCRRCTKQLLMWLLHSMKNVWTAATWCFLFKRGELL